MKIALFFWAFLLAPALPGRGFCATLAPVSAQNAPLALDGSAQFLREMDYRLGKLETALNSPEPGTPALNSLIDSMPWDLRQLGASPQEQAARHTILEALAQPQKSLPSVAAALRKGGPQSEALAQRLEGMSKTLETVQPDEKRPLLRALTRLRRAFLLEGENLRASPGRVGAYLGALFDGAGAAPAPLAFADGQIASQYGRLLSGQDFIRIDVEGQARRVRFRQEQAQPPSPPVPVFSMDIDVRNAWDALRVYAKIADYYKMQTKRDLFPLHLHRAGGEPMLEIYRDRIEPDVPDFVRIDTSRVNAGLSQGKSSDILNIHFHPGRGEHFEAADMLRALARFGSMDITGAVEDLYAEMKKRWIPESEFFDLIEEHDAKNGVYMGELPPALLASFPDRQAALQALDGIANSLLPRREGAGWSKIKPIEEVARAIAPLAISFIDSGDDGDVYKLGAGGQDFAIKLYKGGSPIDEFRALTFFGAQGAKDIMKTYAGKFPEHPREDIGWMLSEFIPSDPPFSAAQLDARGSSSLAKIARKHAIFVGGDAGGRVNSMYVDAGFVRARADMSNPISDREFESNNNLLESVLRNAYRKGREYRPPR